jgi:hypothetical protein
MQISRPHGRKSLYVAVTVVALLVNGCAGIEPYTPRDHREEGPEYGLISGEAGEFVIFRREKTRGD